MTCQLRITLLACLVFSGGTGLAACAGTEDLSLSSTCEQYLDQGVEERHDAAAALSVDAGAQDPGNPFWGPEMDRRCNLDNEQTLDSAFGGSSGSTTTTTTATPTTDSGVSAGDLLTPEQQDSVVFQAACEELFFGISQFEDQEGRPPASVDEIIEAGILTGPPEPPEGEFSIESGTIYGPDGSEIASRDECVE